VSDDALQPKVASRFTQAANRAVTKRLPFHDRCDFDRVERGRLAPAPSGAISNEQGFPVWSFDDFAFLSGDAPDSVNPSLWRQEQLNSVAGLFEIAEGFYQVRGFDLANITFIAGETGWIVIDPLTSTETARAAFDLVTEHLGERRIHAVIYTHSHIDHFAGIRGVVEEADVRSGRVRILAPEGFLEAAISENVMAGNVMNRRATYMYGALLPRGPRGHVGCGLGKTIPRLATSGLIAPTEEIRETGTELHIDGIRIVFQMTPGTEAPAEMNFHFPERRILCMAENCTGNLHNLYTPRGAQVRDALAWSRYIDEALELFASESDIVFASHHWPRFGQDEVVTYLGKQRDLYRYLHDQTLRLANHGLTMLEIAEELELPPSLADEFFNRDYYGTVNHNTKAVYQRYLGWFDGNPANLHPLPPKEAGARYVEFMGGAGDLLRKARACFERGEYRFVAQVVNHLVFADPDNAEARQLQADALEQLGYQAESGSWRGFYLTAAQELRHGAPRMPGVVSSFSPDVVRAMSPGMLLDYMAVRLDGPAAEDRHIQFDLEVSDRGERFAVRLENSVLSYVSGRFHPLPDFRVRLDHAALVSLALSEKSLDEQLEGGEIVVEGRGEVLRELVPLLDRFQMWFDIVTP